MGNCGSTCGKLRLISLRRAAADPAKREYYVSVGVGMSKKFVLGKHPPK